MELRNHPKMTWRGNPSWPPNWKGRHGPHNPLPRGEVGVLIDVELGTTTPIPHCFLIMRYNDQDYYGSLFFDDWSFLKQFSEILARNIGLPISAIGSLDIP
jgi:hypothetical protein